MCFFFFKQKTAYDMRISDWSSDVCSSDLNDEHSFLASRGDAGGARRSVQHQAAGGAAMFARRAARARTRRHAAHECGTHAGSRIRQKSQPNSFVTRLLTWHVAWSTLNPMIKLQVKAWQEMSMRWVF